MATHCVTKWATALTLGIAVILGADSAARGQATSKATDTAKAKAAAKAKAVLDLNKASEEELADNLPGVGPATAKKIVAGRPYTSVDDLAKAGVPAKNDRSDPVAGDRGTAGRRHGEGQGKSEDQGKGNGSQDAARSQQGHRRGAGGYPARRGSGERRRRSSQAVPTAAWTTWRRRASRPRSSMRSGRWSRWARATAAAEKPAAEPKAASTKTKTAKAAAATPELGQAGEPQYRAQGRARFLARYRSRKGTGNHRRSAVQDDRGRDEGQGDQGGRVLQDQGPDHGPVRGVERPVEPAVDRHRSSSGS